MASTITQIVSARVPNEHADKITEAARRDHETVSGIVAQLIADHLRRQRLVHGER